MSTSPTLSPAGSSTYSSNTLHVGDGTWDSTRDDFLLPNIQGLNYATMRYNGMGNRFQGLSEYHSLIKAHGIVAAITFLGVVPTAILVARFYYPNPRLALRLHITLQLLTVLLSTVVLILGYFAVGPSRSLTNPHHGIGVAIYVLVLAQALGGSIIHRIEKGKIRYYIPLKLMLHQWVGRSIALLALAQIPIGLTLYGSPLYLFILYAVAMLALLMGYFILTYQSHVRAAGGYDEGSYITGTQTSVTDDRQRRSGLGILPAALVGGTGLAALRRRFSDRTRRTQDRTDQGYSQAGYGTESQFTDKYSENNQRNNTWRNRIFGGIAGLGAVAAVRRFTNGRNRDEDHSNAGGQQPPGGYQQSGAHQQSGGYHQSSSYQQPGGYPQSAQGVAFTQSTTNFNLMEEGRPLANPDDHWRRVEEMEAAQAAAMSQSRPGLQQRRSNESVRSYESRSRSGRGEDDRHGLARFAAVGGLGDYFKKRRERKEQRRVEAQRQREYENERIFGRQEDRQEARPLVVGDDAPRRETGLPASHVSFREPLEDLGPSHPTGLAGRSQASAGINPTYLVPGISPYNSPSRNTQPTQNPLPMRMPPSTPMPPPPPTHQDFSSSPRPGTGVYPASGNQHRSPYNSISNLANLPPGGTPTMRPTIVPVPPPAMSPNRNPNFDARPGGTVASPPVSVKVRVHDDHVTLRRLNEEEAALERETRRRQRQQASGAGPSDPNSFPGMSSPAGEYRRSSAATPLPPVPEAGDFNYTGAQRHPSELHLPPPNAPQQYPSQSGTPSGLGGMGSSPGTGAFDTGTDVSNYDTNRRRRRAERARIEQARLSARFGGGPRVEFT